MPGPEQQSRGSDGYIHGGRPNRCRRRYVRWCHVERKGKSLKLIVALLLMFCCSYQSFSEEDKNPKPAKPTPTQEELDQRANVRLLFQKGELAFRNNNYRSAAS